MYEIIMNGIGYVFMKSPNKIKVVNILLFLIGISFLLVGFLILEYIVPILLVVDIIKNINELFNNTKYEFIQKVLYSNRIVCIIGIILLIILFFMLYLLFKTVFKFLTGCLLGSYIYSIVLFIFSNPSDLHIVPKYLFLCLFMITFGCFSILKNKYIQISISCLIGSFLVMNGFTVLIKPLRVYMKPFYYSFFGSISNDRMNVILLSKKNFSSFFIIHICLILICCIFQVTVSYIRLFCFGVFKPIQKLAEKENHYF
eukprot:GHVP01055936.1.p1 GENE.GHVP01055936.1~~GHVP01055936.1.p1  ORF type:complete len:257 (+),score=8.73 GHVP01055936.1:2-772(+)